MNTQDTWSLGGREFTSRFILGSGKYSLELIEAGLHPPGGDAAAQHLRRPERGGGRAHRPPGPGAGLRGLCEN